MLAVNRAAVPNMMTDSRGMSIGILGIIWIILEGIYGAFLTNTFMSYHICDSILLDCV